MSPLALPPCLWTAALRQLCCLSALSGRRIHPVCELHRPPEKDGWCLRAGHRSSGAGWDDVSQAPGGATLVSDEDAARMRLGPRVWLFCGSFPEDPLESARGADQCTLWRSSEESASEGKGDQLCIGMQHWLRLELSSPA